jgi:hypothetical protein
LQSRHTSFWFNQMGKKKQNVGVRGLGSEC